MGVYATLAASIGDRRWFRPIATGVLPVVDRLLGRVGWRSTPWPTLLLTTTGRTTGKDRRAPLYFVDHEGDMAVIATNYGRAEPQWSRNLDAMPKCEVTLRRRTTDFTARRARHQEWEPIFERFADFYPGYRTYIERADRDVPIWILRPASGG